jgi:hypothetical protein
LHPDEDEAIGVGGRSFAWEIAAGETPAAQVCEVLHDEKGSRWPMSRIKVYPGEPRVRSLPASEPALTGVTSDAMLWYVWTLGADGQISASDVRRYRRPAGTKS